ncbi:MAG: aminoglycoside phosphotransferase family protein [Prolixibacteraceae bacterium]|jgi:Ser/Thr protein kinase RdoA (MazF antagonist)|nr:aminoglycoside phosphotransferase family protein [Prolixibacteraceae bacterium]MBT6006528.1 aminoglycoside phosphotransferase family protein [Prolixibacteraceae bacterium]MBT6763084.1 aminoglycoside phosphotransferase family protein [Prolixibacteraceae bacterium]MBT6997912.1 aminoglycoside phosphotransferase family protein [Prolixibacteraceae bacterium]MBT7395632.1 aminoglycoside phosphotransferase family protein [Prolixibacteraceae bacterium]
MKQPVFDVATKFQLEGSVIEVKALGEGFINDTFIIETSEGSPNYILQRKNKKIFSPIPAMMENIQKVCLHIKKKVKEAGGDPMREAMTVTPAVDGKLYYEDEENEYWAVCQFIDETIAYEAAETPELAYAGGKGIGKFQSLVSDLKDPLTDILPGFHNIRFRYKQWDEVLSKNPVGRKAGVEKEIEWIESRRKEMLDFWKLVEDGIIPIRVSHNDTKINNILFDQKGEVLCVIDLDTVLSSTVLNDFGDAMRFYTNTGLEDDTNLDNVSMDIEIYKAFAKGYIEEAGSFLTNKEIEYLAFSAKYITYEQVLRFLMDYIDGDNYYKVKSPDHNLVRTKAQYKLLQSMEEQYDEMKKVVKDLLTEL